MLLLKRENDAEIVEFLFKTKTAQIMVMCLCVCVCVFVAIYIYLQIHSFFGKCKFKPLKNFVYMTNIYNFFCYCTLYTSWTFHFKPSDIYSYTIYHNILLLYISLCFQNVIICLYYIYSFYSIYTYVVPKIYNHYVLTKFVLFSWSWSLSNLNFMYFCCILVILFSLKSAQMLRIWRIFKSFFN